MLGKIAGAILGKKVAGKNSGAKGALIGAAIGAVARRGLFPLAMAAGAAYAGKKMWDKYKDRDEPSYPSESSDASVSPPSG